VGSQCPVFHFRIDVTTECQRIDKFLFHGSPGDVEIPANQQAITIEEAIPENRKNRLTKQGIPGYENGQSCKKKFVHYK
jgi:hypothetical protein